MTMSLIVWVAMRVAFCFRNIFKLSPAASQTPKHNRGLVDSNSVAVLTPFELPLPFPAEPEKNVEFSNVSQCFSNVLSGQGCGRDNNSPMRSSGHREHTSLIFAKMLGGRRGGGRGTLVAGLVQKAYSFTAIFWFSRQYEIGKMLLGGLKYHPL